LEVEAEIQMPNVLTMTETVNVVGDFHIILEVFTILFLILYLI